MNAPVQPVPGRWGVDLRPGAVDGWLDTWFDPDAVALRQAPFTVAYLVAHALTLLSAATIGTGVWVGLGLVVLVQLAGLLLPWRRFPVLAQAVLPLTQMVALVLIELGSGADTRTYFTSLVFLPVVSLAVLESVWGVVAAILGSFAVVQSVALARGEDAWGVALTRSVVVPLTALLVAIGVFGVTNRLRARTRALQELRQRQEEALAEVERSRDELASMAQRLQATSATMSGLVDAARLHAVIATEPDGRITVFNSGAEAMLGYARAEAIGLPVRDVIDEADEPSGERRKTEQAGPATHGLAAQGLAAVLDEAAANGTSVREWHLRRRDGETVPCQVVVTSRPPGPDGTPAGYLFIATDVSERRESDRLQDEFIGQVSHELRTPLTGILGYVDLLRLDPGLSDAQRADLGVIERNAKRLERLVSDLLLSVQLSAGTFALLPDDLDLSSVARAAARAIAPAADAAEVQLVVEADDAVPVYGDSVRLAQVVDNLLSNAVKFTPSGGTVTLRTRIGGTEQAPTGVVEVADTGIGIGPDEVDRLTERFYRARSAHGKRIRGIGLGLSITQAIIDAHHGRMHITSALGLGTTFTVEIPAEPFGA